MTADLKPYPAMKDSGVPWLGDVPEHWEAKRARTHLRQSPHLATEQRTPGRTRDAPLAVI